MQLQLTWRKYKSCKHNSSSQERDCATCTHPKMESSSTGKSEAETIFRLTSLSKVQTCTLWNVPQQAALVSSRRTAEPVDPAE